MINMICSCRLLQTVVAIAIVMLSFLSISSFATSYHDGKYNMKHHHKKLAFMPSTLSTVNQQKYKQNKSTSNRQQVVSLNMVEEKDYTSPMRKRPAPQGGDMAYSNENILRQQRYYNDIRKVGGSDCVQDVYVKDPGTTNNDDNIRYWYVGKVARCTGTVHLNWLLQDKSIYWKSMQLVYVL